VGRGIPVFLAGLLMLSARLEAQETGEDWMRCINRDKAVSDDQAIAACTALLQPDREPAASRAKAYFRRGTRTTTRAISNTRSPTSAPRSNSIQATPRLTPIGVMRSA
jgi:hypothetical protein